MYHVSLVPRLGLFFHLTLILCIMSHSFRVLVSPYAPYVSRPDKDVGLYGLLGNDSSNVFANYSAAFIR